MTNSCSHACDAFFGRDVEVDGHSAPAVALADASQIQPAAPLLHCRIAPADTGRALRHRQCTQTPAIRALQVSLRSGLANIV